MPRCDGYSCLDETHEVDCMEGECLSCGREYCFYCVHGCYDYVQDAEKKFSKEGGLFDCSRENDCRFFGKECWKCTRRADRVDLDFGEDGAGVIGHIFREAGFTTRKALKKLGWTKVSASAHMFLERCQPPPKNAEINWSKNAGDIRQASLLTAFPHIWENFEKSVNQSRRSEAVDWLFDSETVTLKISMRALCEHRLRNAKTEEAETLPSLPELVLSVMNQHSELLKRMENRKRN